MPQSGRGMGPGQIRPCSHQGTATCWPLPCSAATCRQKLNVNCAWPAWPTRPTRRPNAICTRHERWHPAVLIGFYRYYFYKNRLEDALVIARLCLLKAARDNALDPDWRKVEPEDAEFGSYDAALPRFYLFTLKAYAYLKLRLGHLEEGRDAALKTVALDPTDKVGASVLLDVLARTAVADDDE